MRTLQSFKITVEKEKLLATLKINRKKHTEDYNDAYNRYYNACVEALKGRISVLQETTLLDKPSLFLKFELQTRAPKDYTEVYDQVIEMLEFCNADSIEITNSQYESWVKDEWDWKEEFVFSTSAY